MRGGSASKSKLLQSKSRIVDPEREVSQELILEEEGEAREIPVGEQPEVPTQVAHRLSPHGEAGEQKPSVRARRSRVELLQGVDLRGHETSRCVVPGTDERPRFEGAPPRIFDRPIHETVRAVAAGQNGVANHGDLLERNEIFRGGMKSLHVPVGRDHEARPVQSRGARRDSVEVVGIPLGLHEALPAPVRTSVEVRTPRRPPVVGENEGLGDDGGRVHGAVAVVELGRPIVESPRRIEDVGLMARVGRRRRVPARQTERSIPDVAREAAGAREVELPVPLRRQLHLETDRAPDDSPHVAPLGKRLVAREEIRRRDLHVADRLLLQTRAGRLLGQRRSRESASRRAPSARTGIASPAPRRARIQRRAVSCRMRASLFFAIRGKSAGQGPAAQPVRN